MTKGTITIVGLGPGAAEHLSLDALQRLAGAPAVRLRTGVHPAVAELDRRGIAYETFDYCYEQGADFETVYRSIADACLTLAQQQDLVTPCRAARWLLRKRCACCANWRRQPASGWKSARR